MKFSTFAGILIFFVFLFACNTKEKESINEEPLPINKAVFPPYITPSDAYFEYTKGVAPVVPKESYQLKVHGLVDTPRTYALEDLKLLNMYDQVQTIECIGNPANGHLVGTARWKGFRIYDLLLSLGVKETASTVKYLCADGYYSSNTLEELKNGQILGALYMNQEEIPSKFGSPLRILNPGYYGVRNPGWVTEIEVTDKPKVHFWTSAGWEVDEPMGIDSKIFFPQQTSYWSLGDTITVGGAAFGGTRISAVEYSLDEGVSWVPASITRDSGEEYVWVFWSATLTSLKKGKYKFISRAIDQSGHTQPMHDSYGLDGTQTSPEVYFHIE